MARSAAEFLQDLLKNITTYYTATYSSDTDLYAILQMYGAELASGSIALETVRNNLFIVTCEDTILTDNFGTYFGQLKYFNQNYNDDRYISSTIKWHQSGSISHQRYSYTNYDQPFGIVSYSSPGPGTNNPWTFSIPGSNFGKIPYAATLFSGSIVFAFYGQPDPYENPFQNIYGPWRLSAYNPVTNKWKAIQSTYDSSVGQILVFGLNAFKPYLGRNQFGDERLWVWDVYDTSTIFPPSEGAPPSIDTTPRILVYEYDGDYNRTVHDSTIATTPLEYHVSNPVTAGWNGTDKSIVFHDKMYIGWSHDNDEPHLVSYDPVNDAFEDYDLYTHAAAAIPAIDQSATTFNMRKPIVIHDNKVMVEVGYTTSAAWQWTERYGSGSHAFVAFGSDLYAGGHGNIYKTSDGENWTLAASLNGESEILSLGVSGSYIYAGTGTTGNIWRSNNGTSWSLIHTDLKATNINVLFPWNGYIYAGTGPEGPSGQILRSNDGSSGSFVRGDSLDHAIYDFASSGSYLYTIGSSGSIGRVYRSDWGGGDWINSFNGFAGFDGGWSLAVQDNYIYGGFSNTSNGAAVISRSTKFDPLDNWNGGAYQKIETGIYGVRYMEVSGSYIYYINNTSTTGTVRRMLNGDSRETVVTIAFDSLLHDVYLWSDKNRLFIGGDAENDSIYEFEGKQAATTGNKIFAFDGTNWSTLDAPSNTTASRKLVDYNGTLYSINGCTVWQYSDVSGSWTAHTDFNGLFPQDMFVFRGEYLLVSVNYGTVYRLETSSNQFVEFYQFDSSVKDTPHLFVEITNSPSILYGYYQNGWYSSSFSSVTEWTYFWPAPNVNGWAVQNAAIPGYRKQLDFMLEAAVHGSTRKGITRIANAFTLVNPDIREVYTLPQWKLKQAEYSVSQLSANTWQFTGEVNFRPDAYAGAHVTFVSGSIPQDKAVGAYLVMVNDNNTVTVGAIEDKRLLLKLVRPT